MLPKQSTTDRVAGRIEIFIWQFSRLKSEIRTPASCVSSENSLLDLRLATISLCPHLTGTQTGRGGRLPSWLVSLLIRTLWYQIRALMFWTYLTLIISFWALSLNTVLSGVRASTCEFGRNAFKSIDTGPWVSLRSLLGPWRNLWKGDPEASTFRASWSVDLSVPALEKAFGREMGGWEERAGLGFFREVPQRS